MRLFDLYFLIASILFLVAPSFGQRIFTYEFKHGENDKYYGRLSYQIVTTINGEEIPLDNKAVIISTENSEDESLVTILINSVELAYKDKSYSSNSQDREAEVFYLGFEEPKAPLGGSIEYISVQKIYDRGTNIGATKTKVVYKFICNKTIIAQSSINLSFKTFFAPRGRNEIFDSRVYQITIPVTIEPSKSAYVNQLRLEKAFDRYKQLSIELGNDPKRKNIPLFENIKKYLSEYKDIKHQKMNELAEVVNQYENRTVGSEEVYDRILRYKEADMLQKAASDINLYVNNCVQKIWVDCPEFENVRYLELKLGKSDTTMLRGFLNKFPSSQYYNEIYNKLMEMRTKGGPGSSQSYGGGQGGYISNSGTNNPFNDPISENMEGIQDSLINDNEPADVEVDYKEALRRITISKTGNWDNVSYYYELVGLQGRLGKKVFGQNKREVIYLDDLDVPTDKYRLEIYKSELNGKYQIINSSIEFAIESSNLNKKYVIYAILLGIAAFAYFVYYNYFKI